MNHYSKKKEGVREKSKDNGLPKKIKIVDFSKSRELTYRGFCESNLGCIKKGSYRKRVY